MTHNQIDFTNPDVIAEIERRAYAENAPALADVLAALHDALQRIDKLEALQRIDEFEAMIDGTETLAQWERGNGPADSYKEFFYDCFERLTGHYPCPSVTNDYDKSIVFLAIERGEAAKDKA